MSAASADFDAAVLGAGLPPEAERLIALAGSMRQQTSRALALLESARELAPTHPASLIALYRFHFYGNRLHEARTIAVEALSLGASMLGLAAHWQDVVADARFNAFDALPRFYLFALKGYAYLSLRVGELERGQEALNKLAQLDPDNRVGHRVLTEVVARIGREDADYEEEALP